MLALCSKLYPTYYAKNYAGIMGAGLIAMYMAAKQQLIHVNRTEVISK